MLQPINTQCFKDKLKAGGS